MPNKYDDTMYVYVVFKQKMLLLHQNGIHTNSEQLYSHFEVILFYVMLENDCTATSPPPQKIRIKSNIPQTGTTILRHGSVCAGGIKLRKF